MKIFKMLSSLSLAVVLCSCSVSKKELVGVYTIRNQVNTVDTLRILQSGEYERALYRKKDNSLIFKNREKWRYGGGRLTLYNYLLDEDNEYSKEVTGFENVLITSSLSVDRKTGKVIIYYRQGLEDHYYEKQ